MTRLGTIRDARRSARAMRRVTLGRNARVSAENVLRRRDRSNTKASLVLLGDGVVRAGARDSLFGLEAVRVEDEGGRREHDAHEHVHSVIFREYPLDRARVAARGRPSWPARGARDGRGGGRGCAQRADGDGARTGSRRRNARASTSHLVQDIELVLEHGFRDVHTPPPARADECVAPSSHGRVARSFERTARAPPPVLCSVRSIASPLRARTSFYFAIIHTRRSDGPPSVRVYPYRVTLPPRLYPRDGGRRSRTFALRSSPSLIAFAQPLPLPLAFAATMSRITSANLSNPAPKLSSVSPRAST